jgi:DNA-damage-inducible protein D
MKKEVIDELFEIFESYCFEQDGVEFWSARELQNLFKYTEWRNFNNVVTRAKESCNNSGNNIGDHFVDVNKMIDLPKNATKDINDILLTRYACYLIAQNGDPNKQEIAFAQTYFAYQTRKQELIEQRISESERIKARNKLKESEKKLSGIIFERGVDNRSFAFIRSEGDKALFGGRTTAQMKRKLNIPTSRAIADFLPTITIKAKDFAAEMTSHNVVENDLDGDTLIKNEHIDNNIAVRKMMKERGIIPENLNREEDIKKLETKHKKEKKIADKGDK